MAIYHLRVQTVGRASGRSARAKAEYNQREGKYARVPDACLFTESGHMPRWAQQRPTEYWEGADLYERGNGRLFKEVEFALPVELGFSEQRALARAFAGYLTDRERLPYTLAIHAGYGLNPHVHLMISEKTNDGIERPREQWFKQWQRKDPARGGAKKTDSLKPQLWLEQIRVAWAEIANRMLEACGFSARIDPRSLAAQGIDRVPGVHLGPNVVRMTARGIGTDRRERAQAVADRNAEIFDLQQVREARAAESRMRDADESVNAGDGVGEGVVAQAVGAVAVGRGADARDGVDPSRSDRPQSRASDSTLGAGASLVRGAPGAEMASPATEEAARSGTLSRSSFREGPEVVGVAGVRAGDARSSDVRTDRQGEFADGGSSSEFAHDPATAGRDVAAEANARETVGGRRDGGERRSEADRGEDGSRGAAPFVEPSASPAADRSPDPSQDEASGGGSWRAGWNRLRSLGAAVWGGSAEREGEGEAGMPEIASSATVERARRASPAVDRTARAVESQLAAMGFERYEIGLLERASGRMLERTWTAEQIQHGLPWLRRQNARGHDVFIRAARDASASALVLVDDLTQVALRQMEERGWQPAVVVETSAHNFQAWVRVPSDALEAERTQIARRLAVELGGDRGSADWRHYGRLAGFTNRKPEHRGSNGLYPYVLLREARGRSAASGEALLQYAREVLAREAARPASGLSAPAMEPGRARRDPVEFYRAQLAALERRTTDRSVADFIAAQEMALAGYAVPEITLALRTASPALERRRGHEDAYVDRTVRSAMASRRVMAAAAQERERDPGWER